MSALRFCLSAIIGLALIHSGPARASAAPESIIVEGQRLHSQVGDFVEKLTAQVKDDQLGRFVEEICPSVSGLPNDLAQDIMGRIRRVTTAVGARVAKAKCRPNLVLLVVHDKQTAIRQLRAGYPQIFGDMRTADIHKLVETPGPTVAWQSSSRLGSDGMPLSMVRVNPEDGSNESVPLVRGAFLSRTNMQIIQHFALSLVVVEARALDQVDTRQLADYAVMRTLAATPAAADLPAPSILSLFKPGVSPLEAPESVTWWDYAFLKALYRSSNRLEASAQRSQVRQMMNQELKQIPTEQHQ